MSGYSDPSDPNYFRLSNIGQLRGLAHDLREWIEEPGDFPDDELVGIVNELIAALWPARQPGFDAAFETDRAFIAALDRGALPVVDTPHGEPADCWPGSDR